MALAVEFGFRSKKVFVPSCTFTFSVLRQNCVYPLIGKTWSFYQRFVFVLSICFSYSIFSLYSIFNERGITFSKHKAQAPFVLKWWRWWGSNPWPPACRAGALPAELHPHNGYSVSFRSLKIEQQFEKDAAVDILSLFQGLFWSISKLQDSR